MRAINHRDCVGVQLLHPNELRRVELQRAGETLPILSNMLRIVADMVGEIERCVRGRRNPAGTGSKHHADGALFYVEKRVSHAPRLTQEIRDIDVKIIAAALLASTTLIGGFGLPAGEEARAVRLVAVTRLVGVIAFRLRSSILKQ